MTKQDRRIKAEAQAAETVEAMIDQAVADLGLTGVALAREQAKDEKPAKRGKGLSPELQAHAPAIREAREAGEAWWALAHRLGLPGSAESVARGKAGAGLARRIYAAAYGELPKRAVSERTVRRRSETNETVREIKATKREERIERVRTGADSVIPADLPDEAVIAMLRGREITWGNNLNDLDGKGDQWSDESANVHPKWCRVDFTADGHRCVKFRVQDVNAPVQFRLEPGAIRTIRLDRIHTVK